MEAAGTQRQRNEEEEGKRWNSGIYRYIRRQKCCHLISARAVRAIKSQTGGGFVF